MNRIEKKFAALAARSHRAFVAFIMGGDPGYQESLSLAKSLPDVGVDIIEIGMPFTDPMADGVSIQLAGQRALAGGQTLAKTLQLVQELRESNTETPIVLMGYYNPIHSYGSESFINKAAEVGVDGLIIVDLPPEEDSVLRNLAARKNICIIRLSTPTTDDNRLKRVLNGASGFLYYVSVTGVTGAKTPSPGTVDQHLSYIRSHSHLPFCVGFGIKTPEMAKEIAHIADGVVVGSAIVEKIAQGDSQKDILHFVRSLTGAVHQPTG